MHSMAQPLTVLRATLEVVSEEETTVPRYQRAIHNSLEAVVRVVDAMGFVHELVRIARELPDPVPVEVRPVLALVTDDLKRVLDEAAISLQICAPDDLPKVLASAARLRQCLFYLVQDALSFSAAVSMIEIVVKAVDEQVQIVVGRQGSQDISDMTPTTTTKPFVCVDQRLALAEALAVSQGGSLRWRSDPFAACLCLPAEDGAGRQMLIDF
jgi:C4-dicarboxylate-specific signal transduction histidine kinase